MPILAVIISILLISLYSTSCLGQGRNRRPEPTANANSNSDATSQSSFGAVFEETTSGSVKGALVKSVDEGGLADSAGVKPGDLVTSLAGKSMKSLVDVKYGQRILQRFGTAKIDIIVVRDGKTLTLTTQPRRVSSEEPAGPVLGIASIDAPRSWGVEGVLVNQVEINSSADEAGIMAGDIIISINGKHVKTISELKNMISSFTVGQSCQITIQRGNSTQELAVILKDRQDASDSSKKIVRRLSDINVLKYAIIDPQSRIVTFIGKYDPNYKTGPIQYNALLNDIMRNPYPSFSLEPTAETRSGVEKIDKSISADVQRMASDPSFCTTWANRLQNLVLNDPTLNVDKSRFLKKGGEAFQISEDEMLKVLTKSLNPSAVSDDDMTPIVGKVLCGLGFDKVGTALLAQSEGSMASFEKLGIGAETGAIVAKFNAGQLTKERATIELGELMVSTILRELQVSNSEIDSRSAKVLNGTMGLDAYTKFMEDSFMAIIVDRMGLQMFNGLTLSHQLLCKLYNVPAPQMDLIFKDVSSDSLLGDTLFRADYALKSICTSPDVRDKIPDFQTEMEYMHSEAIKNGSRIPGDAGAEVGHRLIPGNVKMSVSPSGNMVAFDDAQVNIIGWIIKTVGKQCTPKVAADLKTYTEGYAGYLTQDYDQLAKVYPELHRLRETEKLIALVRWAKTNNYSITVDSANDIKLVQSPTALGFWLAVFTADQQEFSLSVIAEGGASFDKDEGDAWIKPTVNNEATSDISKQLVMSAVLSKQAAIAAIGGDLESARDLAEKGARAMTGDIDITKLPALGDLPVISDPAQAAIISSEAIEAIDNNMKKIEDAKVMMQKGADLEKTSPQEAAALKEMAAQQQDQGQKNLQDLRNALESIKNDPNVTSQAAVTISNINKWQATPITSGSGSSPNIASGSGTTGTTNTAIVSQKPKTKAELKAELDKITSQLEATKAQIAKLSFDIARNQQQFGEWQGVAEKGMDKARDILLGLIIDTSAGKLLERYETMHELALKLPDHPEGYIAKLDDTKTLLTIFKDAKAFKDIKDWAEAHNVTLQETFEKMRDGMVFIVALKKGWDITPAGIALTYGSNAVDLAYTYAQYMTSYDALKNQTKNVDEFNKALASLVKLRQDLSKKSEDLKQQISGLPDDETY